MILNMDYNDIYESYDSEIIKTPNHEQYLLANRSYSDIIRDYTVIARQYVNDDYADSLERFLCSIVEQSETDCEFCDYKYDAETADVENDELTAERDELRNVVDDVVDLLKKYDLRFSHKLRLTRLDVEPLMKELHKIVDTFDWKNWWLIWVYN